MSDPRVTAEEQELLADLSECGNHPLRFGQETHGELHLDARRIVAALLAEREAARTVIEAQRGLIAYLGEIARSRKTGSIQILAKEFGSNVALEQSKRDLRAALAAFDALLAEQGQG